MEFLDEAEGKITVLCARRALEDRIGKKEVDHPDLPPVFDEKRGVFVTLKRNGELRGCIGYPYPIYPLREALFNAAIASATEDPRFPPVTGEELTGISIEVTVLTSPRLLEVSPAERPSHVEVGRHGLMVSGLGTGGLLLPQVATEYGWDSITFLDHTCMKAGLPSGCWQRAEVAVHVFEGQIFDERGEP